MTASSASGGDRSLGVDNFPEDGLPTMPAGLSEAERVFWSQLMEQLPQQLLRKVDVYQLRTLCELLAMKDRLAAFMKADATDLKATRLYIQTSQQINRLSAMFGLDPISRARLKLPPIEKEDDFTRWFNGRRERKATERDSADEWSD